MIARIALFVTIRIALFLFSAATSAACTSIQVGK